MADIQNTEGRASLRTRLHSLFSSVWLSFFGKIHNQETGENEEDMETIDHAQARQNQRGDATPTNKPKATAAVGGVKNRKALEDIGNMVHLNVTDGMLVHRPITRSFGAQLLANAQAAAAAEKVALPDGIAKESVFQNSKPEPVVDISPVTKQKEKHVKKSYHASSSKQKVYSLSSVLTARSKLACGIQDIDVDDADNELFMSEYVEDLYKFYKQQENLCRPQDYMSSQVEINAKIRTILVDWLIEVHYGFKLMPETLYLTMSIIDRYLSVESVLKKEFQLVGISALLIACKYEEIWAPVINDFICISEDAYTREQILKMEKGILNKLDWCLTFPTTYVFLVRFLKAAVSDKEMENLTFFYAELSLIHYSMVVMYCPSMIAAAAIYAAQCCLKKNPPWNKTLEYYTGFSKNQILECAKQLVTFHSSAPKSKLTVVYRKYSKDVQGCVVVLRSPATKFVG